MIDQLVDRVADRGVIIPIMTKDRFLMTLLNYIMIPNSQATIF